MSRATYEPPGSVSPDRDVLVTANVAQELARPVSPRVAPRVWRGGYVRWLVAADVGSALLAAAAGLAVSGAAMPGAPPVAVVVALPVVWLVALAVARSYDRNVLCEGPDEFRRVLAAAGLVLAAVAVAGWAGGLNMSPDLRRREPAGRHRPDARRAVGRSGASSAGPGPRAGTRSGPCSSGTAPPSPLLHEQLVRQVGAGYGVIGCCLPENDEAGRALVGVPVLGGLADVARRRPADTTSTPWPSSRPPSSTGPPLRRLGWAAGADAAPTCCSPRPSPTSAGPRVRVRDRSAGLPLLHVERPGAARRPPADQGGVRPGRCGGRCSCCIAPVLVGRRRHREGHQPRAGVLPAAAGGPRRAASSRC